MELLDIRTIAIIFFINCLLATLFMAGLWQQSRRQFHGVSLWLTSFALLTAAFALISLRNVIPDIASILIANTCLVAAAFILYLGLERFIACPSPQRHNYIILAVFVGLFAYFTFFQPDVAIRIVLLNSALMLMFLQSSWLMLRRVGSQLKPLSRATGIVCLLYAVVACYRIILVIFIPAPGDFLDINVWDATGLLINQILTIGMVLVLLLMVNHRALRNTFDQEKILIRSKVELEISNRDLTEHKRIEASLKESELRYRDLVNFSKNGVAIYEAMADGEDFIIRDFNRAAESIDDVKKEDIIGKSVLRIFPGIKEFGLFEVLQRVWRTGVPERHPISHYHDERVSGWRDNYVYRLSSGEIVAIYNDVTESKQAEEALRVSEERYRSLVETAGSGISSIDLEGKFTFANDKVCQWAGLAEADILGRPFANFVHPADLPGLTEMFLNTAVGKSTGPNIEFRIIGKDGQITWLYTNPTSIILDGKTSGFNAILNDITQRKWAEKELLKSEALLKEAQEVAHIGHWELDPATMIPAWSDEIFHIFGIDPATGEPSFAAHSGLLHPDDWEILNNAVNATIATGTPFEIEFRFLHALKGIRWMRAIGRAMRNDKGTIIRLYGTAQDITNSKSTQENLEKSSQELRSLSEHLISLREEERTLLAREIHDELGQALTALKMDLSWLSKKLPEGQRPLAEKIGSMLKLVDNTVKTVKRLSTELRPGLLDDLGLVAAMEWQAGEFQKRTGIKTELSFEPYDIMVDNEQATALFRIFQEVLTNVARHAAATRIDAYLRERDGVLELSVRDNGKGIEQAMVNSPKSLGLVGMRERCHYLGGTVDIRGKRGKGTTVTMILPAGEVRQ